MKPGLRSAVCLGAAFTALVLLSAEPASAMCGGNIFMTCPPSAQAASAEAAKARRDKRLQAVRAKKRRYPIRMR